MDWSKSGIANAFRFERVGFDLETSYGFIEGITDGTISTNFDGDYKTGVQLDFDGDPIDDGHLVRVWHEATLSGEIVAAELGTFMLNPQSSEYRRGSHSGSVNGYSPLFALDRDRRGTDRVMKQGANVVALFNQIVTAAHCVPYVDPTIDAARTLSASHVWEYGQSVLSECNALADIVGAMVRPDTHGRVCLLPHVEPRKRPKVFALTADNYLDGIQFDSPERRNRVSLRYSYEEGGEQKTIYSTATVAPDHPWSWQKIGRNDSETFEVDSLSANTQAALDKLAAVYLGQQTQTARSFTLQMPYTPLEDGAAGDVAIGPDVIPGVISQQSIELNAAMLQTVKIKELT